MQTHTLKLWRLRLFTFLLAALAAGSMAYWMLKWSASAPASPAASVVFAPPPPTDPLAVARLLGGGQTSATAAPLESLASSRFKLTGVVTDPAHGGYALIAIDGKPAKPYRVGAAVNEALMLHSVAPRSATLAASRDAPAAFTLELPKL